MLRNFTSLFFRSKQPPITRIAARRGGHKILEPKYSPIYFLNNILSSIKTRLLHRHFGQFYRDISASRNPKDFVLFSNTVNEAIDYNIPVMPNSPKETSRQRSRSRSPIAQETNNEYDNSTTTNLSSSPDIDTLESSARLKELSDSYDKARKEAKSIWLDYADKCCYIYLYKGGGEPSQTMAAFDLDGTLIKPKSNKRVPKSATDWDLFSVWTKIKLQQALCENNARFVIFTNQNGVGLNIVPLEEVQQRIELVMKRLDIACTVFVAVEKDGFRKPRTGMFKLFNKSFNNSQPLDHQKSFYCGDAVGYPSHSDADIKFAQKLQLPFLPPEKFLRGVKPKLV